MLGKREQFPLAQWRITRDDMTERRLKGIDAGKLREMQLADLTSVAKSRTAKRYQNAGTVSGSNLFGASLKIM